MPAEYPEQDARTAPFQSETKEAALARREPEGSRRYLDIPSEAEQGAKRNLTLGIIFSAIAAFGVWMGWYYAGGAAIRTLFACLLTFGAAWLLLHLNVLRQRHGGLFGLSIAALLGAAIPFIEGAFRKVDDLARERLAGQTPSPAALNVPPPPVTIATAPPAPPTVPLPPEEDLAAEIAPAPAVAKSVEPKIAKAPKKAPLNTKPASPDGSVRELLVPEPPAGAGKLIRVTEDVKVDLDGRPTIIRGGTVAPFKSIEDGQVTFLAGDHEISIDSEFVKFTGASKESPQEITKLAQEEAMRRYPKLRDADSRENILYVTRVKEMQLDPEMKVLFTKDPKWPLVLAEQLAQTEHWVRADLPAEEGAEADPATPGKDAAPAEIPANELPAAPTKDPLLPPNAPPIPQQSEPPPAK